MVVDDQYQPWKYIFVVTGRGVSFGFVCLRCYARKKAGMSLWWDDWILLTFIGFLFTLNTSLDGTMFGLGFGRTTQWLAAYRPENIVVMLKLLYPLTFTYAPIVFAIKTSILLFYIRIFGVKVWFKRLCWAQIIISALWVLVNTFLFAFRCIPVSLNWTPGATEGFCLGYQPVMIGPNVVNIVADVAILLTPLHSIWHLHLEPRKKWLVAGVLVLGTGACAFSTVRLAEISRYTFEDVFIDTYNADFWGSVEGNFGLICACLPTLGPILPNRWTTQSVKASHHTSPCTERAGSTLKTLKYTRHGDNKSQELPLVEHTEIPCSHNHGNEEIAMGRPFVTGSQADTE